MHDRVWTTKDLHGPLPKSSNEKSMGYEYHLDSWLKYTRTEVEMENGHITYSIRNLNTWEIIKVYEQDY